MENVLLYDKVTVEDDEIGLNVQLYVSEIEWDFVREKIKAIKLQNTNTYTGKNTTTGYQVQPKSIGSGKLADDVAEEIIEQVTDIIPQYSDPNASRPSSNISVIDNLSSTSTSNALSANQGRVLKGLIPEILQFQGNMGSTDDFNDYTTPGTYHNGGTNAGNLNPPDPADNGDLIVGGSANMTVQTWLSSYVGTHKTRHRNGTTWSAWTAL